MEYTNEGKRMRFYINEFGKVSEENEEDIIRNSGIYDIGYDNPVGRFLAEHDLSKPILTEGLIHTYPPSKTVNYISKALKIPVTDFEVVGNKDEEKIFVWIPDNQVKKKLVVAAFEYCGYYLSRGVSWITSMNGNRVRLMFERKYQKDETETLFKKSKVFYHVSPEYYKEKIIKNGIYPLHKNEDFNFPERVYLILGTAPERKVLGLAYELSQSIFRKNGSNDANKIRNPFKWTVFEIDGNRFREGTKLFNDPNFEYGVFTPDNIPRESIVRTGDIDFTKLYKEGEDIGIKINWEK